MKKIIVFLIAFAFTIQSVEAIKLCKTNWPHMGLDCILVYENNIYVNLILKSYSNQHLNSGLSIIFNNNSIPLSSFRVSLIPENGIYTYSYSYSEPFTGNQEFEYLIGYSSETAFALLFRSYSQSSHTLEVKPLCGTHLANKNRPSNNKEPIVSIQPNPFNEYLNVEQLVDDENITTIDIADSTGKVWLSYNNESNKFNSSKYIKTSLLTSGIYFCRIYYNKQTIIRKIIKVK